MHTIWILNKNHARDETKLWQFLCSRNAMYKRDV
jgi:hypothetical protein